MNGNGKRIGLMGCGAVADYGHIPAIQKTNGLRLHAVYDPNMDTLERICQKHHVPKAFSNVEEFFASGIEAVSITSPAPFHIRNVLDAAGHGLPVICEKPLAMNRAEAETMIEAMKKAGCPLHSAFCYRFSPCALKIKELLAAKAIGEARSLRLIYNWSCHGKFVADDSGKRIIQKRREDRMLEGGPLVDCGTHQIDLAAFWMGSEVVRFSSHGAWVDAYDAPDHVWLHMDHANGAHTLVEVSYSYHHTSKNQRSEFLYEIIGADGVIRYDREQKRFAMENQAGLHEFEFHSEKSFHGMYAEWAHALDSGHSDMLTTAEDGMRVVEIARAATDALIKSKRYG